MYMYIGTKYLKISFSEHQYIKARLFRNCVITIYAFFRLKIKFDWLSNIRYWIVISK